MPQSHCYHVVIMAKPIEGATNGSVTSADELDKNLEHRLNCIKSIKGFRIRVEKFKNIWKTEGGDA